MTKVAAGMSLNGAEHQKYTKDANQSGHKPGLRAAISRSRAPVFAMYLSTHCFGIMLMTVSALFASLHVWVYRYSESYAFPRSLAFEAGKVPAMKYGGQRDLSQA